MNDKARHEFNPTLLNEVIWAGKSVLTQLDLRLEGVGLSSAKLWALQALASKDEPVTITLLADCMGTVKSNVTPMVDRLERDNLVRRVRSVEDRREVFIELTPTGMEKVQVGMHIFQELSVHLEALFPPEEVGKLRQFLQQITATCQHP
jgi:DNA-binding MarR family transcriptional regulator